MDIVRIVTNETCDFECEGCHHRASNDRASVAGGDSIRAEIRAAAEANELVLCGGEPTRRGDLAGIVAFAKRHSAARVVIETHGHRVGDDLAQRLHAAGAAAIRLLLPAPGIRVSPTEAKTAGAWAEAAARASARAGLDIEILTVIHEDNVDTASQIPRWLSERGLLVRQWWLRPAGPDTDGAAALGHEAFAACASECSHAARSFGVPVQLDPARYVPPCIFERPLRVAHLYALNRGAAQRDGYRKLRGCGECLAVDRCPGFGVGTVPPEPGRPLSQPAVVRRLTVIASTKQQVDREVVTRETYRRQDGSTIPAAIVRINFHCNQACEFCFVSTHLPPPSRSRVEAAIYEMARVGGAVALSGGEPTLSPDLEALVTLAKNSGVREVELQTNATVLADGDRAQRLADAGVDVAFVSLHGASAGTSDSVTAAPGTYERTVAGLDALSRTSIRTRINFVLCGRNYHEFPEFVELVAARWPSAEVNVSFVAPSTDLVPRTKQLIVRYSDVMPSLVLGLRRGRTLGVEIGGFESMCGIPLCLVPGDLRPFFRLAAIPPGGDGGEFLKPAVCLECVLEPRCFGLRRGYAELHGTKELRPVPPPSPPD